MHWTYKSKNESDLEQGDILLPNEYLIKQVLDKYHPYYSSHPDNQLFIVLTQSCDLVRRSGECKAPYITLAPVRPLRVIIEREFHHQLKNLKPNAQPYGAKRVKDSFSDFLYKLFNNNDPHFFFLKEQQDMHIAEDMCAITALSISIKNEHYKECLKARILQLDDLFQAKLGWLVGQKYSRVGTPDWDSEELSERVNQVISNTAVWVDDEQISRINREVENAEQAAPDAIVDQSKLMGIISSLPIKKQQAIDAIFSILVSEKLLLEGRDPIKGVLRKKLLNDSAFSQFF
jgi:hypothetical protein